jgi:hypothetical protein
VRQGLKPSEKEVNKQGIPLIEISAQEASASNDDDGRGINTLNQQQSTFYSWVL